MELEETISEAMELPGPLTCCRHLLLYIASKSVSISSTSIPLVKSWKCCSVGFPKKRSVSQINLLNTCICQRKTWSPCEHTYIFHNKSNKIASEGSHWLGLDVI